MELSLHNSLYNNKSNNFYYFLASAAGNSFLLFDFIDQEFNNIFFLKKSIQKALYVENCDSALILFRHKAKEHEYKMIVLERDGSISEFCGNGARVIAKYLNARFFKKKFFLISHAGTHAIEALGEYYRVDMGKVRFELNDRYISMAPDQMDIARICGKSIFYVEAIEPHLVVENNSLKLETLEKIGHLLSQKRSHFAQGINISLLKILSEDTISINTFERGVNDVTKSCGTAATSSAALCRYKGWLNSNKIKVMSPGGQQEVHFLKNGTALLIGKANIFNEARPLLIAS